MRGRDVLMIGSGIAIGSVVTWALVHPSAGEGFPAVFRGTTQGVTSDGDGVAFYPNAAYTQRFDAFPAFEVAGENRTSAVRPEVCLAPGTGEQDVVFAVVGYQLAWYECLTEGTDLGW